MRIVEIRTIRGVNLKYPFDEKTAIDLWLPIFQSISTKYFELCAADLHFPLELTDELRQVSKDFTPLAYSAMGMSVPESPPQIAIPSSSSETDPLLHACEYAFSRLEMMGCAQIIYDWGQQLQRSHAQFLHRLDMSDLGLILIRWSLDPTYLSSLPLELDREAVMTIQLIVLRYRAKYLQFQNRMQHVEIQPQSLHEWENFALIQHATSAWMSNELRFQFQIAQWKEIFNYFRSYAVERNKLKSAI